MPETTILQQTIEILAEIINVDPEEIKPSDHLEDDLLLSLETDLPRIMHRVGQEFEISIDKEVIHDFIEEAEEDTDKGTVRELAALIQDEVTLNG